MKILMINYEFPPLGGGAANATYYLLKEFSNNNNLEIDLITSSISGFKTEQFASNIKIYFLNIGKKGNSHYQSNKDLIKYSWKTYWFGKKLIKKQKYDLVHAFFGIPCGYLAMKWKLPFIVSLRGSDVPFFNPRFKLLDQLFFQKTSRKIWKKAKAVIANSDGLKKLALKTAPKQKIELIYNGVDVNKFKPASEKPKTFTIISTSRLIKRKGIEYLIEAFAKFNVKYSNSKLILAGSGDLEEDLKVLAKEQLNQESITFTGAVGSEKLLNLYQQADVFVLPSLNEGMSNSLLEAMACGLAIITTDTGGTRELVSDDGFIIKQKDSNAIFDKLEKLYLDHDLLKITKLKSRQKAENMSWEETSRQYYNQYQ